MASGRQPLSAARSGCALKHFRVAVGGWRGEFCGCSSSEAFYHWAWQPSLKVSGSFSSAREVPLEKRREAVLDQVKTGPHSGWPHATVETPCASGPFVVLNETRDEQFGVYGLPGYTLSLNRLVHISLRLTHTHTGTVRGFQSRRCGTNRDGAYVTQAR